jgi:hypothetical protein
MTAAGSGRTITSIRRRNSLCSRSRGIVAPDLAPLLLRGVRERQQIRGHLNEGSSYVPEAGPEPIDDPLESRHADSASGWAITVRPSVATTG